MLPAQKQVERKLYVVKNGYVYSDAHGNNYRPGEEVSLTKQQYDLARHRLTPVVKKEEEKPKPKALPASKELLAQLTQRPNSQQPVDEMSGYVVK